MRKKENTNDKNELKYPEDYISNNNISSNLLCSER